MPEIILNRLYGVSNADEIRAMGPLAVQGNFTLGAPNTGGLWTFQTRTGTSAALSGATASISGLIPAGSLVFGVTARVMTAVTGATTTNIGVSGTATAFATGLAAAVNSVVSGLIVPLAYANATDVLLTGVGGNFTAGVIKVTVLCATASAPPR
jgi:hypothetical protein